MRVLRESSLHEYARGFWERESRKNPNGRRVWEDIATRGVDPVRMLERPENEGGHRYKLPRPENTVVRVALIENKDEMEALLVHRGMPHDKWMQERRLEPASDTRKLGDLAKVFVERAYFERADADGTQVKCYRAWKKESTLKNAVTGDGKPLIEHNGIGEFEIVDGWGRLIPFVALLQQGFQFYPVEVFVAYRE